MTQPEPKLSEALERRGTGRWQRAEERGSGAWGVDLSLWMDLAVVGDGGGG